MVVDGAQRLQAAILGRAPIVAVLGQKAGWDGTDDPVLQQALKYLGRSGANWAALATHERLPENFYDWLTERFARRVPSSALEIIAAAPLSAVYTSSIDPGIANLLATGGREPNPILVGDPPPRPTRSFRRPPVYYLFGRAGTGVADTLPPSNVASLATRRIRHASPMLRTIDETATPLGLITIEGYDPKKDWLRADDLLAVLSAAPEYGVLWCGPAPEFSDADTVLFEALVEQKTILRDVRSLAELLASAEATIERADLRDWSDPEIVTLGSGAKVVISPKLRLLTQASATILDDTWTSPVAPVSPEEERIKFYGFHGSVGGTRSLLEGIQRGHAIQRDFERAFTERVGKALANHHSERGAIVLHGQSGVGKSIALARLALHARENGVAVLFASGRLPQAGDLTEFLQSVDQFDGINLLIADVTAPPGRYDDLLSALRSAGHRIVIVGSSYLIKKGDRIGQDKFIEAPSLISTAEKRQLGELLNKYSDKPASLSDIDTDTEHVLARFYRSLPESRGRISEGLGREIGMAEQGLRARGARPKPPKSLGTIASALIQAGFPYQASTILPPDDSSEDGTTAGKVIDLVMASSRLFRSVPASILLRAAAEGKVSYDTQTDSDIIAELFRGEDILRRRFADDEGSELLIGARLQIEAEIICNRRLGGPAAEAACLVKLIAAAYRAGPEDNEETRFVADIVQSLGPDGPAGDRYRDQLADIARALTDLRRRTNTMNGRLMLQESALRRAYVRLHTALSPEAKAELLVEATHAVDGALQAIDEGRQKIFASRRTKEHLLVERAATYGFLATDAAQQTRGADEIWSSYKAAREATNLATARVDSYHPLDIALWTPARILREAHVLGEDRTLELKADLWATLDSVDPDALDPADRVSYLSQKVSVSELIGDPAVGDAAFEALIQAGSAAGFFIRAKMLAPRRSDFAKSSAAKDEDIRKARAAILYLRENYDRIVTDVRCLQLLLSMEWLAASGRWLFNGLRQPLPADADRRLSIAGVLLDLELAQSELLQPRYRYLQAVLTWLDGSEDKAIRIWRQLDYDTKFVEAGRVLARHVIADPQGQPRVFDGVVERQIGPERWSVYVETLRRRVDLLADRFKNENIAVGRTVRDFSISFNYRGPLADRASTKRVDQ